MPDPTRVELSVSGILNGTPFSARGTLTVNRDVGTKSGTLAYSQSPSPGTPTFDSITISTGKCFVGAKHVAPRPFLCPFELLGSEFVSLRLTTLGDYGIVSVSEKARVERGVLHSDLTTVGTYRLPSERGLGPLRERITVYDDRILVSEGRYSYLRPRGRPVPVRYTHFYRSLDPPRSFSRNVGRSFELRASIRTRLRGRLMRYDSRSTVRPA